MRDGARRTRIHADFSSQGTPISIWNDWEPFGKGS
jgi:hypothetical protein